MSAPDRPPADPPPISAPPAALSTMWAVQPRFERDLPAFVDRALELGYGAVEVNHSMDAAQIDAIRGHGGLPVTGVHAPAPRERHSRRGWSTDLNLASLDEGERELAVRYSRRSIETAADVGAPVVVVHLGEVGGAELAGERRRRDLFERGETAGGEWARAGVEAVELRAALAGPHLAQAGRSLAELASTAQAAGVTLGLECRLRYHHIPLPDEMAALLADYPPAVVGYCHDVGHAEVLHRLGLVALDAWFELLSERLVETHLHDVRGIADHRAPGNGDVDFAALAARLPPAAARTLEIDQREPDADVAHALDVLRAAGVVG